MSTSWNKEFKIKQIITCSDLKGFNVNDRGFWMEKSQIFIFNFL
jgi:hypothetical protein